MLLQVRISRRTRYGVCSILRPGSWTRRDQIPWEGVAGQPPMLLHLLLGTRERVAVHDAAERLPKLGLRLKLAELALLAGETACVRCARLGLGLGRERGPVFALHGVQGGEKLPALLKGGVAGVQGVDLRLDFRRPDGELYGFLHGSISPIGPARHRR